MRFAFALAAMCAVFVSHCRAEEDVEDPDVLVLSTSNFDEAISKQKYILVEFYAPWCGHCKQLKPHYAKAATALKEAGSEVVLAKVDATAQEELAKRFEVKGYPTLFWFVDGEKLAYTGGRTEPEILQWIERKTSPPFTTGDEVPEAKDRPVVVMKAASISDDFKKTAESMGDDAVFHFIESAETEDAEYTVQHKGEELVKSEAGADLKAFVSSNLLPKFGILDGNTYAKYTASGKGMVWVLLPMATSEELSSKVEPIRAEFTALASSNPEFKFVYIDTVMFQKAIEGLLGVTEFPAVVIHKKAGDKKKYIMRGDDSTDATKVGAFVKDVVDGKVEPTLKSEAVPEENDKPVRVVVGSTMVEEIFKAEKDILFEVYAPWCGHCKKLAPELDKLASKIRKDGLEDLITIAKMDGTENDSPLESISWEGFPTMFYIKAGTSTPLPFNGGRDAKSIWKWIKSNHSKSEQISERLAASKATKEEGGAQDDDARDEL